MYCVREKNYTIKDKIVHYHLENGDNINSFEIITGNIELLFSDFKFDERKKLVQVKVL